MDANTTLLQLEEKRSKLYTELYSPKITEDRCNTDYSIMREIIVIEQEILLKSRVCVYA